MKFSALFLLVLAVLGVSAKPQPNISFQSNGFNGLKKSCRSSLPMVNSHIQASAEENPTINFPTYVPPTTISASCHCLNTLVRPQIRNEIITVPTVDRIVRTVTTPIVETINCGSGTRLATFPTANNILSGNTGTRRPSDGSQSNTISTSGSSSRFFNEGNEGEVIVTGQNGNSFDGVASTNGVNVDVIAKPSIFTLPNPTSRIINTPLQAYSNVFSGNSNFSNGQMISGF